jgi:hypothetical protein
MGIIAFNHFEAFALVSVFFTLYNFKRLFEGESIYIKKKVCLFVCLFVRYAFSPCNSYRHQTFHDTSLGPEEGRHGVGITKKGQEGVPG